MPHVMQSLSLNGAAIFLWGSVLIQARRLAAFIPIPDFCVVIKSVRKEGQGFKGRLAQGSQASAAGRSISAVLHDRLSLHPAAPEAWQRLAGRCFTAFD